MSWLWVAWVVAVVVEWLRNTVNVGGLLIKAGVGLEPPLPLTPLVLYALRQSAGFTALSLLLVLAARWLGPTAATIALLALVGWALRSLRQAGGAVVEARLLAQLGARHRE